MSSFAIATAVDKVIAVLHDVFPCEFSHTDNGISRCSVCQRRYPKPALHLGCVYTGNKTSPQPLGTRWFSQTGMFASESRVQVPGVENPCSSIFSEDTLSVDPLGVRTKEGFVLARDAAEPAGHGRTEDCGQRTGSLDRQSRVGTRPNVPQGCLAAGLVQTTAATSLERRCR